MSEQPAAPAVFVSHASEDAALAVGLVDRLEQAGVRCWIAPRDIRQGEMYADEIMRGIRACPVFILLHSAAADASQYVWRETNEAVTLEKTILPIRLGEFVGGDRMRFLLAAIQWEKAELRAGRIDHRPVVERVLGVLGLPPAERPLVPAGRSSRSQGRRGILTAVVCTAGAALAGGLWVGRRRALPTPLRGRLDVRVLADGRSPEDRTLGGVNASVRNGERVRIEAEMDPPACMYVVWLSGEGAVPVYPWKPADWKTFAAAETPRPLLQLPERADRAYPMKCGAGVEAVLLLARPAPLQAGLDVAGMVAGFPAGRAAGDAPPRCRRLVGDGSLVDADDGVGRATAAERGLRPADFGLLQEQIDAEAAAMEPLRTWWRDAADRLRPHFQSVQGIVFVTVADDAGDTPR